MKILALGLCLALPSFSYALPTGAYPVWKGVDQKAVVAKLRQSGFLVASWGADNGIPYVALAPSETKDPTSIIQTFEPQDVGTIRALVMKLQAGTIAPAEKDQLLLLLAQRFLAGN